MRQSGGPLRGRAWPGDVLGAAGGRLLPPAAPGSAREAQYRRFSQRVAALSRELRTLMANKVSLAVSPITTHHPCEKSKSALKD